MSETPPKVNLDAALAAWPEAEKSPMEWEESARVIDDRVRSGDRGATAAVLDDEKLLASPLGQSVEDGHNSAALQVEVPKMTMPADRERDRRSLQDLAKMAQTGLTPPPPSVRPSVPSGVQRAGEAKGDDSGLIDLRAVASEPAPAAAAPAPGLASQGLFDEEPQSVRPPPSSQMVAQPAPSLPPMPASMPPASMPAASMPPASLAPASHAPASMPSMAPALASSSQPAFAQKKKSGAVVALLVGGIVAVGAAAAGTFFYLKSQKPAPAPVAATETQATPDVAPPPAPAPTAAAQGEEPSSDEATLDPNSLPTATPDHKVAAAPKTTSKGTASAPKAAAEPKAEAKLSEKDLPAAPSGPAGDLGAAMGKAVGDDGKPKSQEPVPAAGSNTPTGSVPQKPSQGAVTGAIGSVLRNARACLGPDDPVSHATVVFGSDGAVQSVNVSGAAAGKPAEACIKTALMKAKVGPFAEPSYTTRITVRHN